MIREIGYLVILATSFIGNIVPFGPALYLGGITVAALDKTLNPIVTIIFATVGATFGKAVVFFFSGSFGKTRFKSRIKNFRLVRLVMRHGWLAALLAAATPFPDDLVAIPLGLSSYSPWRFIASTFVGKSILISLIVWGVRGHGMLFAEFLQIV